jgi:hypothetical protein
MTERKYLPTFGELCDRLSIVQLKAIKINRDLYNKEREEIEHDIDLLLRERDYKLSALDIRALMIIMLSNVTIWENESKAREGSAEQNDFLRLTHSINGCRNTAKNVLMKNFGGRLDYKVDCLAADLPEDFGNWRVFE